MQIFKLYFKLMRQHIRAVILYVILFVVIFTAFTLAYKSNNTSADYETTKVNIAVFDEDHSTLSESLLSYINEKANIVDIQQDEEKIKDALFFEQIVYVVTIPEHFEENFMTGSVQLETQQKPDSVNGYLVDTLLNSYLQSMKTYLDYKPNASISEIHALVQQDLKQKVNVSLYDGNQIIGSDEVFEKNLRSIFFNYLTYMFLALNILTVGMVMITINKREVRMRNIAAPTKLTSYNLQLLLANLVFSSTLWAIFMVIVCIISPGMLSQVGSLYMLNSFIFTLVCLSLGYLISVLFMNAKNTSEALSGVANIVSLGSSFLCGAFVPQAMIGESVLFLASFTPAYWYVRMNNEVMDITNFTWDGLSNSFLYMGVEILFGIAFISIAFVISKSKRSVQEM